MDTTTLILSAGIQAVVGFLVWVAIRRPIDQLGDDNKAMRAEISQLRDQRMTKLERDQSDLQKRMGLVVAVDDCKAQHREWARSVEKFQGAVIDLAHVQEKVEGTAKFVSEVNGRVMGLISDVGSLAALERRIEMLEDKG